MSRRGGYKGFFSRISGTAFSWQGVEVHRERERELIKMLS